MPIDEQSEPALESEEKAPDGRELERQQTQLTSASNLAIVHNLKRIEENYQTYAESHVELAKVRLEVGELKDELEQLRKEKGLIQKSQTSLCGFLQDLRDRMSRGASVNEMQRMIARKLVVHAKYSEQGRLRTGLTDDEEDESLSNGRRSGMGRGSRSRGRSNNRSREGWHETNPPTQVYTVPVQKGDRVINLQQLA